MDAFLLPPYQSPAAPVVSAVVVAAASATVVSDVGVAVIAADAVAVSAAVADAAAVVVAHAEAAALVVVVVASPEVLHGATEPAVGSSVFSGPDTSVCQGCSKDFCETLSHKEQSPK